MPALGIGLAVVAVGLLVIAKRKTMAVEYERHQEHRPELSSGLDRHGLELLTGTVGGFFVLGGVVVIIDAVILS